MDGARVSEVEANAGRVLITTDTAIFTSDNVVICPGAWANDWMKMLGIDLKFEVRLNACLLVIQQLSLCFA